MPRKKKSTIASWIEEGKKVLRELDGSVQALTGSSLKHHFTGALKDFSDSAHEKTSQPADNYAALGVTPTTPPEKIKKVYLGLVKLYHESGEAPNDIRMRDINSAYEAICRERGWSK